MDYYANSGYSLDHHSLETHSRSALGTSFSNRQHHSLGLWTLFTSLWHNLTAPSLGNTSHLPTAILETLSGSNRMDWLEQHTFGVV